VLAHKTGSLIPQRFIFFIAVPAKIFFDSVTIEPSPGALANARQPRVYLGHQGVGQLNFRSIADRPTTVKIQLHRLQ
jgi:hypothetical protein